MAYLMLGLITTSDRTIQVKQSTKGRATENILSDRRRTFKGCKPQPGSNQTSRNIKAHPGSPLVFQERQTLWELRFEVSTYNEWQQSSKHLPLRIIIFRAEHWTDQSVTILTNFSIHSNNAAKHQPKICNTDGCYPQFGMEVTQSLAQDSSH